MLNTDTLPPKPKIVGILNVGEDSFSDGGEYSTAETAIEHGLFLYQNAGADLIDVGAESSHPDSKTLSATEEISKLTPVVSALISQHVPVSVDTYKAEVMQAMANLGVKQINDITAVGNVESVNVLKQTSVEIVIMFSRHKTAHPTKSNLPDTGIIDEIKRFFGTKIEFLLKNNILENRIILDPGMGFFLGGTPKPSLLVLKYLKDLHSFNIPLYVSTSRKSFVGDVLDARIYERAIGTVTTELWLWLNGRVNYIRTHDPRAINHAMTMWSAINNTVRS